MSGARGDFVASLPRRLEVLRGALRAVEDQPRDAGRINGLLRRLHALGSAARVLGFASVAEALGEAEKTLRKVARSGPAPTDLADVSRALDLLPSLVLGAKVSIRAVPQQEAAAPQPDFPLSVLVFGPQPLADALMQQGDLRVECERTEELGKARELSRVFGPDVAVIDADRKGARELVELFVKDPVVEPIPIVVVGDFASSEISTTFIGLGATRVLPKPVSPDVLRRTLLELRDHASPTVHAREPLGELNVNQLVDRIALEIRRGLVEAVDPSARGSSVGFGEGTDVMSAVWGTVARLRELVTLRSDGNVRFEQTGPEGAVPFAPWNDDRRVGERGSRENRTAEGVSLQGRRVVVADDDPAVVWFLSGILKAVGAEVFEAHDGERAFELTASLWPDLVVSDVLMPKLDGFSLCHEIKRDVAVRDVPVILLSWKEDLLQRVRELGGDADGYLRKEAAASTVVERLREVLRPRARVEQRVASGGEVRGRLDGLTPRLVLELSCRAQRDVRVSIRDASFLYEVQVRQGAPRTAIRSASDGSFERGEGVLAMLLGVSAGRFVIEPDDSPCRAELSGSLHEQLAGPVARARAAQRALSAGALASVTRVAFDAARVGGYLECTPEPAQSLLRELITGASPRDLLTTGRAPARLLEAVLSDFARRGGVLLVETAGGVEDISQTRIPPAATPNMTALSVPLPEAAPVVAEREPVVAEREPVVAEREPEPPPVSQRKPPAIYSQPPDSELESADAGWFTFQIESSAQPPKIEEADEITAVTANPAPAVAAQPARPPVPRAEDPLRKTLSSTAPAASDEEEAAPGTSVPVERGHRPPLRTDTLGSAGNEAAAAQAAVAAAAVVVPGPLPAPVEKSPPRPAVKIPRPVSPVAPPVVENDALAAALSDETPSPDPVAAAPAPVVVATATESAPEPAPAEPNPEPEPAPAPTPATFGHTLPLAAMKAPAAVAEAAPAKAPPSQREPKRSEVSTQPPKAAPRSTSSKAPSRPTPTSTAAKPEAEAEGGWLRTAVFAVLAAGASYYGVTKLFGAPPPPAPAVPAVVAPAPVPVTPSAAAPAPKLQITTTDSALPPGTDLPAGNGLLEIQVPDGTPIRVDNEYLGMGPGRRVPLTPGPHSVSLGDAPPQTVTIKAGQRTLAAAAGAATPAPAGSP
ncbi:MAG TPA: response regulator [Polyangiaceae bacterium]|nr:response regulator [Polyangiaceae bacterium]